MSSVHIEIETMERHGPFVSFAANFLFWPFNGQLIEHWTWMHTCSLSGLFFPHCCGVDWETRIYFLLNELCIKYVLNHQNWQLFPYLMKCFCCCCFSFIYITISIRYPNLVPCRVVVLLGRWAIWHWKCEHLEKYSKNVRCNHRSNS